MISLTGLTQRRRRHRLLWRSTGFHYRWVAKGQKINFAKNTRIVVETTPRHSAPIKPDPQP